MSGCSVAFVWFFQVNALKFMFQLNLHNGTKRLMDSFKFEIIGIALGIPDKNLYISSLNLKRK